MYRYFYSDQQKPEMPPYPDEQLPVETWSLQEFIDHSNSILENAHDVPALVDFVLAGRTQTAQGNIRVNIDVFKDCVHPNELSVLLS